MKKLFVVVCVLATLTGCTKKMDETTNRKIEYYETIRKDSEETFQELFDWWAENSETIKAEKGWN